MNNPGITGEKTKRNFTRQDIQIANRQKEAV